MATKDQERKALEQIKKIVAGLGEESYVGRAFEGVFEIAEDNIENDFWNNPKEAAMTASKNLQEAKEKIADLEKDADLMREKLEDKKATLERVLVASNNWQGKYNEAVNTCNEYWNKYREQEDKAEQLEQEIMKLKAKLYDYLVKE